MLSHVTLLMSFTFMVGANIQRPTNVVDMSYAFNNRTLYWPTSKPFKFTIGFRNWTKLGFWYEVNDYEAGEHGGTHMDAPVHFHQGKWRMDDIPPENFIAEGIVIDIKEKVKSIPNAQLTVEDIKEWEKKYRRISPKSLVIMNSGWQTRWPDKQRFLGTTTNDISKLIFPGFQEAAVLWLAKERQVVGLGVDTPSLDPGQSKYFKSHQTASENNLYVLKNIANVDDIPANGSLIFALPMKISGGSGAPCRVYSVRNVSKPNHVVDMTYPFDDKTIYWPTAKPFKMTVRNRTKTSDGYWYESNDIEAAEHGGTHLDAPAHFFKGKWRVDDIPAHRFIGEGIVIDIREKVSRNSTAEVTIEDLVNWERKHKMLIPEKSIVFMNSGWQVRWPDKERYLGTTSTDISELKFPGFHHTAAEWLAVNRKVYAIGVDTPSIDHGPSTHFKTHVAAFQHELYGLENVANLDKIPSSGSTIYALPNKISDGSGAPCRIFSTWTDLRENSEPTLLTVDGNIWLTLVVLVVGLFFLTKFLNFLSHQPEQHER